MKLVDKQVSPQVASQAQAWSQLSFQVWSLVSDQVESQIWSRVRSPVWSWVSSQIEDRGGR